jgi:hypothetical protein
VSAVPLSQLGVDALAAAQAAQVSAAAALEAANDAAVAAAAALAATKYSDLPITITDIVNTGFVVVPTPALGRVIGFKIAATVQMTNGDLTIAISQNGVAYPGSATLTTSDNTGAAVSAVPIGAFFDAGSSIELEITSANTAPGVCVVVLTYEKA